MKRATAKWLAMGCIVAMAACGSPKAAAPEPPKPDIDVSQLALTIDPVCSMSLEKTPPVDTYTHEGKQYGFCSSFCKDAFAEEPGKYLANLEDKAPE